MKVRIKGNSLRLRLSQSEVSQLGAKGSVDDKIDFGTNQLTYSVSKANVESMVVTFVKNEIKLEVPANIIEKWLNENEVGFSEELITSNNTKLSILVEKDFQCLTERKGEDESDLFQNPAYGQQHG